MSELIINPDFKDLIPPLSPDEYNQLEQNILAEGCRDAIVTWQGVVVDGHNRYELCVKHGIPYKTTEKEFGNDNQAEEWIIRNQFGRRNLSDYQRTDLALKLKPSIEAKAKEKQIESGGAVPQKSAKPPIDTRQEIAQIAGVSHDTVHKVETIQNNAPEPIKKAVESNEISINKAHDLTKKVKDLPEEEKAKKAEELLAEQKQSKEAKKAAKSDKPAPKQKFMPDEEALESGKTAINEVQEAFKQANLAEEDEVTEAECSSDEQKQTEQIAAIYDVVELQKMLEEATSKLGVLVGQVETIINELPELGEYRHIIGIYIDAIHKYAERIEAALKLKLRSEKKNVG